MRAPHGYPVRARFFVRLLGSERFQTLASFRKKSRRAILRVDSGKAGGLKGASRDGPPGSDRTPRRGARSLTYKSVNGRDTLVAPFALCVGTHVGDLCIGADGSGL